MDLIQRQILKFFLLVSATYVSYTSLADDSSRKAYYEAKIAKLDEEIEELKRFRHRTIMAVSKDLDNLSFNTGISRLMEFTNELTKSEKRPRIDLETLVLLLAPYAPHLAEEA